MVTFTYANGRWTNDQGLPDSVMDAMFTGRYREWMMRLRDQLNLLPPNIVKAWRLTESLDELTREIDAKNWATLARATDGVELMIRLAREEGDLEASKAGGQLGAQRRTEAAAQRRERAQQMSAALEAEGMAHKDIVVKIARELNIPKERARRDIQKPRK